MDGALWSSVAHVLGADNASSTARATALDYAAYADLALTVPKWQSFTDDMRAEATAHLRFRLGAIPHAIDTANATPPGICNFSSDAFSAVQLQRLERWFATEQANTLGLAPADDADLARVRERMAQAFEIMARADPELYGEITAILDQIITVRPDDRQRLDFTAGSSFAVWGAIIVNSESMVDWTEAYNTLVHEAGHILLFAIARDEPLVLNANEAAFVSPVRDDLRPMDGIFHAAFVAAREAGAHDRVLAWHGKNAPLSDEDARLIAESLEMSVITFWQSVNALENGAKLAPLGQTIIDQCKDAMSRKFALVFE